MRYLHRHTDSRQDVRAWLPWAKSVVVVASNYHQKPRNAARTKHQGQIAMYARGEDYHVVLREKLEQLVQKTRERIDIPFQSRICVDTSAIIERELAAAAGIGWIGKNTMVLHQSLGSFFFLGTVITDLALVPDTPVPDHCGTCTRCLDACPTDAFPKPYVMDASRCISYLTIEHRDDIEPELSDKIGDWLFGCDDCQTVCPYNRDAPETTESRFQTEGAPNLDDIQRWDPATYRQAVRGKATERAKLHMWQRNAEIVRRNLKKT